MKKITLVMVLLLSFGLMTIGHSQNQRQPNRPARQFNRMERFQKAGLLKKLNLTDQQKEKIRSLRFDFQKKMIDLKADLQKSRLDLKELRQANSLSRNDVIAAVEKINKSRDAISLAVANHLMDVYEVLTPEQQKIWKEIAPRLGMMGRRSGMMRKHFGRMRSEAGMQGGRFRTMQNQMMWK